MNRRDWLASMAGLVTLPAWLKPRVVEPIRVGCVDFYVADFARPAMWPRKLTGKTWMFGQGSLKDLEGVAFQRRHLTDGRPR